MSPALRSLLLAATVLLAACGGSSSGGGQTPEQTLEEALDNLRAAPGVTAVVTLRSTPASLQALAAASGKQLSAEDAGKILGSSLTVSSRRADDPSEAASRLLVDVAGRTSLEARTVDSTLYLRADVLYLLETFGQPPGTAEAIARQAEAAGVAGIRPLIEGRWVSLRDPGTPMGAPATSRSQRQAFDRLLAAVRSATRVTSEGTEEAGEHLVARVDLREVVARLGDAAGPWGPGAALPDPAQVPDRPIAVDLWVDDGDLARVELDVLQLHALSGSDVPPGVDELAIRVALSEFADEVEAPSDAVPVDLGPLLPGLIGAPGAGAP